VAGWFSAMSLVGGMGNYDLANNRSITRLALSRRYTEEHSRY
jgi:hypothetical protein